MARQRTVKGPLSVDGVGLQTGRKVTLKVLPAPVNTGVSFIRVDLPNKPLLNIRSMSFRKNPFKILERRTTLEVGPLQVQTTEHLLAALSGLGIDNIAIELDSEELPGLDGSAAGFVDLIRKAGVVDQNEPKKTLRIDKPVWCESEDSLLAVLPYDGFRISYTMSYPLPALGTRLFDSIIDEKTFEAEIAPARTFCLEEEARELLKRGLGKGANYENTLVIGPSGPLNNSMRFPDEPVRHKVLDLIGDLYVLGRPIEGRVVAVKSGHRLNMELVRKISDLFKER